MPTTMQQDMGSEYVERWIADIRTMELPGYDSLDVVVARVMGVDRITTDATCVGALTAEQAMLVAGYMQAPVVAEQRRAERATWNTARRCGASHGVNGEVWDD